MQRHLFRSSCQFKFGMFLTRNVRANKSCIKLSIQSLYIKGRFSLPIVHILNEVVCLIVSMRSMTDWCCYKEVQDNRNFRSNSFETLDLLVSTNNMTFSWRKNRFDSPRCIALQRVLPFTSIPRKGIATFCNLMLQYDSQYDLCHATYNQSEQCKYVFL